MYFFIDRNLHEIIEIPLNEILTNYREYLPSKIIAEDFLNKYPEIKIVKGNGELIDKLKWLPIIYSENNFQYGLIDKLPMSRFRTMLPLFVSRGDVENTVKIYRPAGAVDYLSSLRNYPEIIGHKSVANSLDVEIHNHYETDTYISMDSNKHKTLGPFLVEYFQAYQEMFPQYFEPDPEV